MTAAEPANLDDSSLELELLAMRHRDRLERFELDNREFFATRISDRGDAYFAHFTERLAALVAENEAGTSLYFVVLDASGRIVGRVNINDTDQPELTEIGFRIAADVQGKGVATRGVLLALDQARSRGVQSITARVADDNPRSRHVLQRCGFIGTGPAAAPAGSPRTFAGYRIQL